MQISETSEHGGFKAKATNQGLAVRRCGCPRSTSLSTPSRDRRAAAHTLTKMALTRPGVSWLSLSLAMVLLQHGACRMPSATPARPANAVNLTVFALRPYNLSATLDNKNTADAKGDIFFYLGDRFQTPMACRHDPSWYMCRNERDLARDSVYTETVVEVDGTFGGCPTGARACSHYAACNPTDATGETWRCKPTEPTMGKADVRDRYPNPKGNPPLQWDWWKYNVSKIVGGTWYSTQASGHCGRPNASECQWRVVAERKTVNASCTNANLLSAVQSANPSCFSGCSDPKNITTDCFITCVYNTVIDGKVTADELEAAWLQGFRSEDPLKGGCKALPPYHPPPRPHAVGQ